MSDRSDDIGRGETRIAAALAAQTGAPVRPKRFFKVAEVVEHEGAFELRLDGRPAKTPARRRLSLPNRAAADALAAEWNAIGEVIDPAAMPLTRIVNAALDGVAAAADAVEAEVANYMGTDLLVYRAGEPAALVEAQARGWDPILDWYGQTFRARFILAQGVMHVTQPPATLRAMRAAVSEAVGAGPGAPFRLAALNVMTTLTGSALLALAVLCGRLSAEEAWRLAHVDETFQESQWGQDEEAMERRNARAREMRAAALLADLT